MTRQGEMRLMVEKPRLTRDIVTKIEDSLEERKMRRDRRRVAMKLPTALERRAGKERRGSNKRGA